MIDRALDWLRLATFDVRRSGARRTVVHLVPSVAWGGAERLACTMHRLAQEHGWDSRIDAPSVEAVRRGIAAETGAAVESATPGEDTLLGWARAARTRVRTRRPSILHAHLPFPDRMGPVVLASAGRPLVATFQLLPERARPWPLDELLGQRSDRVLTALSLVAVRAHFIAVSRDDHNVLTARVPRRRLHKIANAPPYPRRVLPDLPPFAWHDRAVRLLSAGRLHRQKGYDRLIAALASPEVRSLPWQWLLAGDGPEHEKLVALAAQAGIADRMTFAPNYPASMLYADAELVLSPSRWEGMPLVPMEAIEAGTPVVASSIEPHRELLAEVPDAVLPEDEARWPSVLARFIGSHAERAGLARAQRSALPAQPRLAMWQAYEALYCAIA